MKLNHTGKPIYHHFTCATDTGNIRHVFDDVSEIVASKIFRDCDLF